MLVEFLLLLLFVVIIAFGPDDPRKFGPRP